MDTVRDAHNTPDLTPGAADSVRRGADVRRMTVGYDTGDQKQTAPPPPEPAVGDTDVEDDGTIDTDTGLDFGAFGGRDVGTDIGGDVASGTD
jgi:hypothetical protein